MAAAGKAPYVGGRHDPGKVGGTMPEQEQLGRVIYLCGRGTHGTPRLDRHSQVGPNPPTAGWYSPDARTTLGGSVTSSLFKLNLGGHGTLGHTRQPW